MKISYNWLKDFIECDLTPEKIGEVLTSIGLEVEGIETVETIPGGLRGVVVGEVLTCEKHPDADRLSITTVNLGHDEIVQIVCGAPNVRAGQKVLVATVGTELFPLGGDSFQIKKSKIRGAESHGMICAEDELGLGKSHDGIMVLDENAVPGTPAANQLNIPTDYCLEIGLTPNRTDAFSHYGVARDLAAALRNMQGIGEIEFALNKPSSPALEGKDDKIKVIVENQEDCPRYMGLVLENIKVTESPDWLKQRLATIGVRPINNVVDITNYIQHEIGQPLHAFDLNKVKGNQVVVRRAKSGEQLVTLDGIKRDLDPADLMICDAEKPMCIAGVFGGNDSGVDENTISIFLESAYFNPVVVRKTARRHALNTDASFRFERGADPNSAPLALMRAAALLKEYASAEVTSKVYDFYPTPIKKSCTTLSLQKTERLIGQEIPSARIRSILKDLEIEIIDEKDDTWSLEIPLYRVDVTRDADVIEEILRIYGFNNIDFPKALRSSISLAPKPDKEKLQNKAADLLAANAFHEIMCMSLTKLKYATWIDVKEFAEESAVKLLNPLSQDLGMMRQTLLFGGLEAIELNKNHRSPDLRLFEFGKVYHKYSSGYLEQYKLSIWLTGRQQLESWNNGNNDVAFYDLKKILELLLTKMGVSGVQMNPTEHPLFHQAIEVKAQNKFVGVWGLLHNSVAKNFDLKQNVYYADLNWDTLVECVAKKAISYKAPEKFPAVRRDLSLLLEKRIEFTQIEKTAFEAEKKLLRKVGLFDVYEGKNLETGKKSYAVNFTLQDSTKTMTDDQVDAAMTRIVKALDEKLGAKIRS